MVSVRPVVSNKDLKAFVSLPKRIYQNNSRWVSPLWGDEMKAYQPKHNPFLQHSPHILFLAEESGIAVGRLLAYVDSDFNRYYGANTGFFGAFEALDSPDVWAALFQEAETWFRTNGVDAVRGPINPVAEHWGILISGFEEDPVFMSPYNPEYYLRAVESAGYAKAKDLLAYVADVAAGYRVPERFSGFRERFLSRNPGFSLRRFDLRNLKRDSEYIWMLSNETFKDNWGYVPVGKDVMEDMIRRLKPIADPGAVWFVEDEGEPVAFCLGYPDVNPLIKRIGGKLFPFGFVSFFTGLKALRRYRLFGLGVLEKYRGKGLDVLLYTQLQEALAAKRVYMEANYILEDNANIRNALEKLGMELRKTYRVFEKRLF